MGKMKVTKDELTELAYDVNSLDGWVWIGALIITVLGNAVLGFMGSWAILPVGIVVLIYFHNMDKWVVRTRVEKLVASKSSGEIQVDA